MFSNIIHQGHKHSHYCDHVTSITKICYKNTGLLVELIVSVPVKPNKENKKACSKNWPLDPKMHQRDSTVSFIWQNSLSWSQAVSKNLLQPRAKEVFSDWSGPNPEFPHLG